MITDEMIAKFKKNCAEARKINLENKLNETSAEQLLKEVTDDVLNFLQCATNMCIAHLRMQEISEKNPIFFSSDEHIKNEINKFFLDSAASKMPLFSHYDAKTDIWHVLAECNLIIHNGGGFWRFCKEFQSIQSKMIGVITRKIYESILKS